MRQPQRINLGVDSASCASSPNQELTSDLILFKECLALSLSPSLSLPVCLSILVYLPTNLEETLALDDLYEKARK